MGNLSTKVENASIEAGNASIELKMASVDVENASIGVEMKAGVGDGVKILTERVSSYDDIGMSLLFEDSCKIVLEIMLLSDTSTVDAGNEMLKEDDSSTEVNRKLSSSSKLEAPCEGKSVGMTIFEEGSDGTADIVGFREKPIVSKKSVLEDIELVKEDSNVANNCCLVDSASLEDIGIKGGCVDSERSSMLSGIENE